MMKRQSTAWIAPTILLLAALISAGLAWNAYQTVEILVEWSTASEFDVAGFNLYRSTDPDGEFVRITASLLPPSTDPLTGGDYEYLDTMVEPGITYFYNLEEVEITGAVSTFGPIEATASQGGLVEGAAALILLVAALFLWIAERRRTAQNYTEP